MLLEDMDKDFEWYNTDQAGYMAEQDRREKIWDSALKKFMGPEFKKEPLYELEEVESRVKDQAMRLTRLRELKAPQLLLDNEQRMLEEALSLLQKGKYISTYAEREYKTRYWERYHDFCSLDHKWNWE